MNMNKVALVFWAFIICQMVFSNALVHCETPSVSVEESATLQGIRSLLKKNEYPKAAAMLKDYISQYPNSEHLDEVFYYLGLCYEKENKKINPDKWANAIHHYRKVIDEFPESFYLSRAEMKIGRIYLYAGEYDQAIAYLKKAVAKNNLGRQMVNSLFYLARSYQAKGEEEEAKKIYRQIINDYPDSYLAKRSQEEMEYLSSTKPEDRKKIQPLYRLYRVVKTHRTGASYQSGLELGYEAIPGYSSDKLTPENLTSVEVTFTIKESYARWKSRLIMDGKRESGEQEYEIRWDKGPGPFLITIDRETGKPSQDELTGEATVIIKTSPRDIVGKSASITFNFNDYLKTLTRIIHKD